MLAFAEVAVSAAQEWEAGVILAFLAFFVTFFVLSILAVAIYLSSKVILMRKRGAAPPPEAEGAPVTPKPTAAPAQPVAAAQAGEPDPLEIAAAIAAVRHYLNMRRVKAAAAPVAQGVSAWVVSWLRDATKKEEINPYLKRGTQGGERRR